MYRILASANEACAGEAPCIQSSGVVSNRFLPSVVMGHNYAERPREMPSINKQRYKYLLISIIGMDNFNSFSMVSLISSANAVLAINM